MFKCSSKKIGWTADSACLCLEHGQDDLDDAMVDLTMVMDKSLPVGPSAKGADDQLQIRMAVDQHRLITQNIIVISECPHQQRHKHGEHIDKHRHKQTDEHANTPHQNSPQSNYIIHEPHNAFQYHNIDRDINQPRIRNNLKTYTGEANPPKTRAGSTIKMSMFAQPIQVRAQGNHSKKT